MKRSAFLLPAMLALACTGLMHAAPGDITAEIIAPSDSPTGWVSEGHAFLCLSVESASGVQEECYGFYNTSHSGQVFIGSPTLTGYYYKGGAFTRTKTGWEEVKTGKSDSAPKKGKGPPPGVHIYKELSHDDTWLFLKDPDRSMDIRLPLHSGMSQWKSKADWVGLFEVTPKVE